MIKKLYTCISSFITNLYHTMVHQAQVALDSVFLSLQQNFICANLFILITSTLEKLQKSDHEVVLGAKIKQLKDRFKSLLTIDERESMWHDMKCLKEEDNQLSQLCIKLKTGLISQKNGCSI